jgi:perosamine synthetase
MIPLAKQVIAAIQSVVGTGPRALHEPVFRGNEWSYLKECLDTTYVASEGRFVDRFESDLAAYTRARYAIAVSTGTAALHVALKLVGVKENDEVLIPDLTFVATANAVTYCGAVPHFVDCKESTLGLDPVKLGEYLNKYTEQRGGVCFNSQTERVIRAIVPMHTFGHPADLDPLLRLAADHNLVLVEDAAEALGSFYHGQHAGTFGTIGILSFNGNKIITSGGGGAILTNNKELATQARHLTQTAKMPHPWDYIHDQVGYNYRLPNLNAALGCAQLEQLSGFLQEKRELYLCYKKAFSIIPEVKLFSEPIGCRSNYWLQTILLNEEVANDRDAILKYANESGYRTRPAWRSLSELSPYHGSPRMRDLYTRSLVSRIVNIPSSVGINANDRK